MEDNVFEKTNSAGVSIVLYCNPIAEVIHAVDQVLASPGDFHLVLIDNSQPPLELPSFPTSRVSVFRPGKNVGYGAGHNLAMTLTGSRPYHFVLNADLEFGPDALPAMISYLSVNPDVGLAMPKVVYPDGQLQYLCRLLPDPLDLFGRGLLRSTRWAQRRNRRYENHAWTYDEPAQFPFLSGCFMALRRSVIDRIGGFDERYFLYGEDLDLSRRINAIARTMFTPVATVVHEYRSERKSSAKLLRYKLVNLCRYFNKWGWFFDKDRKRVNQLTIARLK